MRHFILKILLLALGLSVLATAALFITAFLPVDAKPSTMNKVCRFIIGWPASQSQFLIEWLEDGSDDPDRIGGVGNETFYFIASIFLQWFAAFLTVFACGSYIWRRRHKQLHEPARQGVIISH